MLRRINPTAEAQGNTAAPEGGEATVTEPKVEPTSALSNEPETKTEPKSALTDDPNSDPKDGKADPKEGDPVDPKDGKADPKEGKPGVAPESYEAFKLPEGVAIADTMLTKFSETAKSLNLSQEQAQAVVDLASEHTAEVQKANLEAWMKQRDEWVKEVRNDKEFGGTDANYNETMNRARLVIRDYGDDAFKKSLAETGLGDNPGLARMLCRISKATGEAPLVNGKPSGTEEISQAQAIYGKSAKK